MYHSITLVSLSLVPCYFSVIPHFMVLISQIIQSFFHLEFKIIVSREYFKMYHKG